MDAAEFFTIGVVPRPVDGHAYLDAAYSALGGRRVDGMGWREDVASWPIAPGLTDREVDRAQARFGLRFPADLRALLQYALATGAGWPDWRDPDHDESIAAQIDAPYEAMRYDVTRNDLWFAAWGVRPDREADRVKIAFDELDAAPRLAPVYGHRYLPCDPLEAGNPVFSMAQIVDTVYYGANLADYLAREFGVPRPTRSIDVRPRTIRFWSAITTSAGTSLACPDTWQRWWAHSGLGELAALLEQHPNLSPSAPGNRSTAITPSSAEVCARKLEPVLRLGATRERISAFLSSEVIGPERDTSSPTAELAAWYERASPSR